MIRNGNQIKQMKHYADPVGQTLTLCDGQPVAVTTEKAELFLPVPGAKVGNYYLVRFVAALAGAEKTYSPAVFATETEEIVDYGLERGDHSPMAFHTTLVEHDGMACAHLYLLAGQGEMLAVSNIRAEAPEKEEDLFGGVEMIFMEPQYKQMQGVIFRTPEGHTVVFDGGNKADIPALGEQLMALTDHVDAWFVTHYHCDHVAAIVGVLEQYDVHVNNFYYDFRGGDNPAFIGDGDISWIARTDELVHRLHGTKIDNVVTTNRGNVYVFGSLKVTVLNDAYFGENDDNNPGNDSGVAYKIETPKESVLMLGDIGWTRGDVLLQDEWFVREMRTCRVVQMAHHGQNGVTREFYQTIDEIKVCLYAASQWLFDVDRHQKGFASGPWRTLEVRKWMRHLNVSDTYTSIDGRLILH